MKKIKLFILALITMFLFNVKNSNAQYLINDTLTGGESYTISNTDTLVDGDLIYQLVLDTDMVFRATIDSITTDSLNLIFHNSDNHRLDKFRIYSTMIITVVKEQIKRICCY